MAVVIKPVLIGTKNIFLKLLLDNIKLQQKILPFTLKKKCLKITYLTVFFWCNVLLRKIFLVPINTGFITTAMTVPNML
jgi:hypothetical protein